MTSKLPNHDERDDITSLVSRSTSVLATRASLIGRGLRDISERLRANSLKVAQDEAMELLKQERLDEAIVICTAALDTDPVDEILWQIKGVCLAKLDNLEEGLDCFDHALQSNAENPYCWVLKSRLLLRLNRTQERLECWRRVIGIESDFSGAWKEIGCCLLELGNYEEAAEAFDSELKLHPLDSDCRSRKDVALRELTRSQQDLSERHQSFEANPTIILTIGHWWTEPYYKSPPFTDMKCFNLVCHIQNLSDQVQFLGKESTVLHRSKATGEISKVANALLLEAPPETSLPLQLAPNSTCEPVVLELLWPFPAEKSDEECVREILDGAYETLACDDEFETLIMFTRA